MKVSLAKPLDKPMKFRVTYNGRQILLSREFAPGELPSIEIEQPRVPGEGKVFVLMDGKEIPMSTAKYSEVQVAALLVKDSEKFAEEKNIRKANKALHKAIEIYERVAPDSKELAEAYKTVCFRMVFTKVPKNMQRKRWERAVAWYENAITVYERHGDQVLLGGNLTNMSVIYRWLGDAHTALARCKRAFDIQKARSEFDAESIGAWNHLAATYLMLGNLDEAEAIVDDGLRTLGEQAPHIYFLLEKKATIFEARAKELRAKAAQLRPPAPQCGVAGAGEGASQS